ncbi:MAG TPA: nucleoside transporter C-terminal domain-containing protein [Thermoanaerobaculia bacterium]|nr:nucleoside transporter C-terminal domain-containing protein [Thermoanaerobaculia bacterium]
MERFIGLLGILVIIGAAYALSLNRRAIRWKTVAWGLGLQLIVAIAVLKGQFIADFLAPVAPPLTRAGASALFIILTVVVYQIAKRTTAGTRLLWTAYGAVSAWILLGCNLLAYLFETMRDIVNTLIGYTGEGARFVFGPLGDENNTIGFIFATRVLPTIIFIASIFAVLYYIGVMQVVVRFFARIMTRTMGASGAESTTTAASIFMGQTESPLTIRPFLPDMTMSELLVTMVSGMATVSGGIMVSYVLVAKVDIVHLLTASVMAAPAAIALAKMILPETEEPKTGNNVNFEIPKTDVNLIDAAGRGAIEGLHLSLNVAGMLIAFIALVAMVNGAFGYVHQWLNGLSPAVAARFPESLDMLLGWIFRPVAWLIGVPWKDAVEVGNLLGVRMVLNEFVAFVKLGPIKETLDPKSFVIATYALCGFANFSSIAIQIGGIGSLAPTRRGDLARLGLRAMLAGTMANFMTAAIAGILL